MDFVAGWLFPSACPVCLGKGDPGAGVCRDCLVELPQRGRACALCADQLCGSEQRGTVCGRCLAHPPVFERAFAAFPYVSPIADLIRELKFGRQLYCASILGKLLAMRAADAGMALPDCFVPVPLHRERLRYRGFNQAVEIVRTLSCFLKVPFDRKCLGRTVACVPQTALPARQRRRNPGGTFLLKNTLEQQFVVIVDDVMTTGATVNEIARLLRKAGVARVEVWVAARTHV